jgi:hypothetical protein
MTEFIPPNSDIHPMRIIFLLPREPPPKLTEKKGLYEIKNLNNLKYYCPY